MGSNTREYEQGKRKEFLYWGETSKQNSEIGKFSEFYKDFTPSSVSCRRTDWVLPMVTSGLKISYCLNNVSMEACLWSRILPFCQASFNSGKHLWVLLINSAEPSLLTDLASQLLLTSLQKSKGDTWAMSQGWTVEPSKVKRKFYLYGVMEVGRGERQERDHILWFASLYLLVLFNRAPV